MGNDIATMVNRRDSSKMTGLQMTVEKQLKAL